MTQDIKFTIDGKDFFYPTGLLSTNPFTVQSIPRSYQVHSEKHQSPFEKINRLLTQNPKNVLLIDAQVFDLYQPNIHVDAKRIFKIEAKEAFKTLQGVTNILNFLQKNELTKTEQFIVVGGGITLDLATFSGAIYKRATSRIYFPTTLLSMCDSCIGGKAGLNYNDAKNFLSLISPPSSIYLQPSFLNTLTQEAIRSGLGEILKSCILGGDYFLDIYKQHVSQGKVTSPDSFQPLILAALGVKKTIIEADEFELNHRRSLNYGHTLGHAIEILSDYKISHGQAIVIGMILANELSHRYGLLYQDAQDMLNKLCYELLDPLTIQHFLTIQPDSILSLLQKDKKTEGQNTYFVLIKKPGETHFVKLALDNALLKDVKRIFENCQNESRCE